MSLAANWTLLAFSTLTIAGLAAWIGLRARSFLFPMGIAALYFWSLYGGWFLSWDLAGGDSGMRYGYLFEKLFPVVLDRSYFLSLCLYSLFVIVVELALLFILEKQRPREALPEDSERPTLLSHRLLIGVAAVSMLLSFLFVKDVLGAAVLLGKSAYGMNRLEGAAGRFYTLHQLLNRVALIALTFGFVAWISGARGRFLRGREQGLVWGLIYAGLLAGMFGFCFVLGNKNELVFSVICGVSGYIANSPRPRYGALAVGGLVTLLAIASIDYARGLALTSLSDMLDAEALGMSVSNIFRSNEAFGAHLSLYGILHFDVPVVHGYSIFSLFASVVPRALWPDRPDDVYFYYAQEVGAVEGQGYAIHHASGWYLNFGLLGVILGAALLGAIWAKLFNDSRRLNTSRRLAVPVRIFTVVAPWTFTAGLVSLVRAGLEGYKGVVIECFILPTLLLTAASWRFRMQPPEDRLSR